MKDVDFDTLAKELRTDNCVFAEIRLFEVDDTGRTVARDIHIKYHENDDYHWTTSVKVIR